MGSGPWYVTNVFEELTQPGEYFFDPATRALYVYFNASSGTPPPASWALVASQLEVFFNLTGESPDAPITDVTFAGIGLRDQRDGQLTKWVDPSGGDWGLRRAALFHLENTERVTITGSTFYRTDANAIILAAYNRNATISYNEFAFVGMTCVATFGRTVQDDGTGGEQPWGTVLAYNKAREIGAYQLQSSFWFNAKATLTRAEGNIVFNIPRAAINLNDGARSRCSTRSCARARALTPPLRACALLPAGLGGGNNITLESIFNTCRHSGDHGCAARARGRGDGAPPSHWGCAQDSCALTPLFRPPSPSQPDQHVGQNALSHEHPLTRRRRDVRIERHGDVAFDDHRQLRGIAGEAWCAVWACCCIPPALLPPPPSTCLSFD